ncbi:hypothetical protein WJX72_006481 [[Myrmecia] bisecta]|uniref:Beta-lactamase-related domain-containing protein n=1 Tax=[Myrmecia] bisecta TaxID=41462 RepID=A0AAW1P4X6_9CHLO
MAALQRSVVGGLVPVVCLLLAYQGVTAQFDAAVAALSSAMTALEQGNLFSGVVHVEVAGNTVFEKAYGKANYELDVPMKTDSIMPIGSNTKFFTAVAIHQLAQAGKLDLDGDVAKYFNLSDFGAGSGNWCPRVYNQTYNATVTCEKVTLRQLLGMAGGVLGVDNCAYAPDSWQAPLCWINKPLNWTYLDIYNLMQGTISVADVIHLQGFLPLPLEFTPGNGYHYSNPGFYLAGYVIEKVSGMPYGEYIRTQIIEPAGLNNTHYYVTNGADRILPGLVELPSYGSLFKPVAALAQGGLTDSLTSNLDSLDPQQNFTAELQPPFGGLVAINRLVNFPGEQALGGPAGAMVGTAADLARWYYTFTTNPGRIGLTTATMTDLLRPYNRLELPGAEGQAQPNTFFAQGMGSVPSSIPGAPYGVAELEYLGSLANFEAGVRLYMVSNDVKAAVVATVFSNLQPNIPTDQWPGYNATSCTLQDANGTPQPVPQLWCQVSTASEVNNYIFQQVIEPNFLAGLDWPARVRGNSTAAAAGVSG